MVGSSILLLVHPEIKRMKEKNEKIAAHLKKVFIYIIKRV